MDFTAALPIFPEWVESAVHVLTNLLINHPRAVVMTGLVICIGHIVFKKIIDPQLYDVYKFLLNYWGTLQLLKDELEKHYDSFYWDDPEFCKAYLSLYAAYRELRTMAKRDHRGQIDRHDKKWLHFDIINMFKK